MSPRAAWRFETLGFSDVYDFVPGKAAWLAMGWGREGTAASTPNVGELVRTDVPGRRLGDTVGDARREFEGSAYDFCLLTNEEGIFMGRLRDNALAGDPDALVDQAMEGGYTTVRPSEHLDGLVKRMTKRGVKSIVISDLKGKLIGALIREDAEKALEARQSDDQ